MRKAYESEGVTARVARRAPAPVAPPATAAERRPEPEEVARPPRVAVLTAHGMGQQVAFQTIDDVTSSLIKGAKRAGGRVDHDVVVTQVRHGEAFHPRAELALTLPDGTSRQVHLYEAYWAPLAEGRITTWETFRFLVQSGIDGTRRAWRGLMKRHMFADWQYFSIRATSFFGFVITTLTIAALGVMNAVIVAAAVARGVSANTSQWPSGALLVDLTVDFALWIAVTLVLGVLGLVLPAASRRENGDGSFRTPPVWLSSIGNWLARLIAVWTIVTGVLVGYHLFRHINVGTPPMWADPPVDWLAGALVLDPIPQELRYQLWIMFVVWISVTLLSWVVRHFLLQFLGDVAIYVSAHRVNRFHETRQAIKSACAQVARCVYGLRDDSGRHVYDRVILVGHSLGSVVSYDVLNLMIREDENGGAGNRCAGRTAALITFGSPLDKTAFVFRSQGTEDSLVRESLAESVQPLITDYAWRPERWINIWSKFDWISGELNFYDRDPSKNDMGNTKRVLNVSDPEASTPLAAHNEYWSGTILAGQLWKEITR